MRKFFRFLLAAVALVLASAGTDGAMAQSDAAERIAKIANRRLNGTAFATLRGLTYQQCERRCLAEQRCKALEHTRGIAVGSAQCRLFSAVGAAHFANGSDIGYKRPALAKSKAPPVARSAPPPTTVPTPRSASPPPGPDDKSRSHAMRKAAPPQPGGVGTDQERGRATEERASRSAAPESARREEAEPGTASRSATRRATQPSVPRSGSPGSGATAAATSDWAVVPVFFGTDRSRRDLPKRIGYGADRGRKLEVGRALITVPKAHQVPNVERPWTIRIPYTNVVLYQQDEDPKKHFTIQELKALSREQLLALIRDRLRVSKNFQDQALIFVHGYNNGFDDALFRTAQIAYDLNYDGAPFLYSWPSGQGIAGYPYDRESAQQAEPYFKQFLLMVLKETDAKNVSIIAHSMGNQLLLQALRNLDRSDPKMARIKQIILAAPDVDRDSFAFLATQIRGVGQGITMYASSNDVALGISRRFAGGIPRAGDVPVGVGPLVVAGVDTIDVSALSTDYLALNHSSYAEKTGLLKDIELVLRTGVRPPEVRLPLLERVKGSVGDYWRYPK